MQKRTMRVVDDDSMVTFTLSQYLTKRGYEVLKGSVFVGVSVVP